MNVLNINNRVKNSNCDNVIQIAGAGPAGLAAAITLAKAGRRVLVHEAKNEVGYRFKGDLQGLENWTDVQDVLAWLQGIGIDTNFEKLSCRNGVCFDYKEHCYEFSSHEPLFYMLERGPGSNSLDHAMLTQAQELGVEIRFRSKLNKLVGAGILATGPKVADAIAVGYHFETNMENGFWIICDNKLALRGYAYLLVMNGKGTVKSCMFSGFKQEQLYVERTVNAFKRLVGLQMINPRPHGGVGNFNLLSSALSGTHPLVGEQAGFQDTLWGFGMRHAIRSGVLAAQSLLAGSDYNCLWQQELRPQMETAVVNRALFTLLGNRGYSLYLKYLSNSSDLRTALQKQYHPLWIKRLLLPWANRNYASKRKDKSCNHVDCSCVWCRCGQYLKNT